MNKRSILFCSLTASLFVQAENDNASTQLATAIANNGCLAATFEQTMTDTDGAVLQQSHGKVSADKPRMLNWEIAAPDNQRIVSDGSTLWRYEPDLEQVIISSIGQQTALPLDVLSGSEEALSQYAISLESGVYTLVPTSSESYFNTLNLRFDDANRLGSVHIVDNFDQLSVITFEHQTWDCTAQALYQFEPPEGIDVIFE